MPDLITRRWSKTEAILAWRTHEVHCGVRKPTSKLAAGRSATGPSRQSQVPAAGTSSQYTWFFGGSTGEASALSPRNGKLVVN